MYNQPSPTDLRKLFGLSSDLFCIAGLDGYFRWLNGAWSRTLGWSLAELKDRPFLELVHPDDQAASLAALNQLAQGQPVSSFRNRFRTHLGDWRWLEWSFNTADGEIYASARDVTILEHTERALRRQKQLFKSLFRDLPDPLILADAERRIFMVNPAAERTFGYGEKELLGRSTEIIYADTVEFELAGREHFNLAAGEQSRPFETRYRRRDGSTFTGESVGTLVRDERGRFLCFMGHIRDISERKEVERVKNELISVVSHELRTPLTSIIGSLGLINGSLGRDLSPQIRDFLDKAHQNSERLAALVDDLLDMERLASGRMQYRMGEQNLAALVGEALDKNAGYAARFRVELRAADPLPDCRVEGDFLRLLQVMNNLLSNAIKFSPAGETVTVALEEKGSAVRVVVADRGPGIPVGFRQQIFERFTQADASATRSKGGTGLGLAISRAIVDAHRGSLDFGDRPGGGTMFYFTLPLCRPSGQA